MTASQRSTAGVLRGLRTGVSHNLLLASAAVLCGCLTGCLGVRTRAVDKTILAADVRQATLDELLKALADRYAAVQTLHITADITASTGGARQGQVSELPKVTGFIFLRKPADLRVLMLVPIYRSRALDMSSDGKEFKLLITVPLRPAKAYEGPERMETSSKNGLENLRPNIIRDALQVPPVAPDEFVTLTTSSRILAPAHAKKEAIEEPDYDLAVLKKRTGTQHGQELQLERLIHISRINLLPYEQDLYDDQGRVVTTIQYGKFQKFGELDYPTSITLRRPLDEYALQIDVDKLVVNEKLDDEQFKLVIPDGVPVKKM